MYVTIRVFLIQYCTVKYTVEWVDVRTMSKFMKKYEK
jgi:hypothetical protein